MGAYLTQQKLDRIPMFSCRLLLGIRGLGQGVGACVRTPAITGISLRPIVAR